MSTLINRTRGEAKEAGVTATRRALRAPLDVPWQRSEGSRRDRHAPHVLHAPLHVPWARYNASIAAASAHYPCNATNNSRMASHALE